MVELQTPDHLRSAPAARFTHYFAKRDEALSFYRRVRRRGEPPPTFTADHVLYHSWLPGFIELDAAAHEALRTWMRTGGPAPPLPDALARELASRGWCAADTTPNLDQLVEKAFTAFPAIQNPTELRRFLAEVHASRPSTVVEIGTAGGGLLYCLSQLADPEALLVSIDDPHAPDAEGPDDDERALLTSFANPRQRLELISARSSRHSTRLDLTDRLEGRKVDLLVIDGDHSYNGVKGDFEMYRGLVADDGVIAFHDIMMLPETWGPGFDVGLLWSELSCAYPAREIVDNDAPHRPPPPESATRLGMPALGFGLLTAAFGIEDHDPQSDIGSSRAPQ